MTKLTKFHHLKPRRAHLGWLQAMLSVSQICELDLSTSSTDDDDPHALNDRTSSDTDIAVDASPLIESDARLSGRGPLAAVLSPTPV